MATHAAALLQVPGAASASASAGSPAPAVLPAKPAPNFLIQPPEDFVTDDEWASHMVALETQIVTARQTPATNSSDATILSSDDCDVLSDKEAQLLGNNLPVAGGEAVEAAGTSVPEHRKPGNQQLPVEATAQGSAAPRAAGKAGNAAAGGRRRRGSAQQHSNQHTQVPNNSRTWQSVQDFRQHWAESTKLQARSLKSIACMSRNQTALLAKIDGQRAADVEQLKGLIMSVQAAANWAQQVHVLNMELSVYKHEFAQRHEAWVTATHLLQERETELMLLRSDYESLESRARTQDASNKELLDQTQSELTAVTEQLMARQTECRELRARNAALEKELHEQEKSRQGAEGQDDGQEKEDGQAKLSSAGPSGQLPASRTSSHNSSASYGSDHQAIMQALQKEMGANARSGAQLSSAKINELIQKSARLSAKFLKQWKEEHNKMLREKDTQLSLALQRCRRLEGTLKEMETAQETAKQQAPGTVVGTIATRRSDGSDGGSAPAGVVTTSSISPARVDGVLPWLRQASSRFPSTAPPTAAPVLRRSSTGLHRTSHEGGLTSELWGVGEEGEPVTPLSPQLTLDAETVQVAHHEVQLVHAELKGTKAELAAVQMQLSAAQTELLESQGDTARAHAEVLRVQKQLEEMEDQLQEANEAREMQQREAAEKLAALTAELAAVKEELAEVSQKLGEAQVQLLQQQQSAPNKASCSQQEQEVQTDDTGVGVGVDVAQVEKLQAQIAELQQQVEQQIQALGEREKELNRANADYESEHEMHEAVLEELQQTKQRLAESQRKQGDFQREVAALREQRDTAALELADAHAQTQRTEDELQALQEELDRVGSELQHTQQQLSTQQAAATASEAEITRLKGQLLRASNMSRGASTPALPSPKSISKGAGLPPLAPPISINQSHSQPSLPASPNTRQLLLSDHPDISALAVARGSVDSQISVGLTATHTPLDSPRRKDMESQDQGFTENVQQDREGTGPAASVQHGEIDQAHSQQVLLLEAQVSALSQELEAARQRLEKFIEAARAVVAEEQEKQQQAVGSDARGAAAGGIPAGRDEKQRAQSAAYMSFLGLLRDTEVMYSDQGSTTEPCLSRIRMLQGQLEHLLLGMVNKDLPPGSLTQHITEAAKATGLPLTLAAALEASRSRGGGRVSLDNSSMVDDHYRPHDLGSFTAAPGGHDYTGSPGGGGYDSLGGADYSNLAGSHHVDRGGELGLHGGSPWLNSTTGVGAADIPSWAATATSGHSTHTFSGLGAKVASAVVADDLLGDLDGSAWELPELEPPPDFS